MRVLEYADVSDEQRLIVSRETDAERIPSNGNVADDGGEVVRLVDATQCVEASDDLRGIEHMHLEAALVHDIQVSTVAPQRHVARERALEPYRRVGGDRERTVEGMRWTIQVHRADDLPGECVRDPDVPVLTTRQIHASAVARERDAHEACAHVDSPNRWRRTLKLRNQGQRKRSRAA